MFAGFEDIKIDLPNATIRGKVGGAGAPLLLLHGYPQTHAMWHDIAQELAKSYRVVATDLRGYGDSLAKDGDMTFRAMARDQVEVMRHLGHETFHVVSHDRGSRTAHRMALDHPRAVRSIALMDILPTLDVWRIMDDKLAMRYFHWMFLAQPSDMPQQLINKDPITFMHATLLGLSGSNAFFHPDALAEYERTARNPDVVKAWCGDYRAGATVDRDHDRENVGQTNPMPCLIVWGSKGIVAEHLDPIKTWQVWFPNAVGQSVEAGHFVVEEQPDAVLELVNAHLDACDQQT